MPVASCRQGSRYCVPFACRRTPRTATGSRCSDALQGEKSGAGAERARAGSRWSVCVFVKRDDGSVGLTASALPVSVAACMLPEPVGLGQPLSSEPARKRDPLVSRIAVTARLSVFSPRRTNTSSVTTLTRHTVILHSATFLFLPQLQQGILFPTSSFFLSSLFTSW